MNKPLLKSKLWIVATGMLLLSAFNVSAQTCVVGGTDFDTQTTLFDPVLANDETGWFNEDVGEELEDLCGTCQYYSNVDIGIQRGVLSNSMTARGDLFTPALWNMILTNGNSVPNGFQGASAIVANPKLIDPRLKEFHNNMFVNAGATHIGAFFSYSATGLTPGATVTFTADVYNLLDLESAAEYAKANGGGDFTFGGYNYAVNNNQYYGNTNINVIGSTTATSNQSLTGVSTPTIAFGGTAKITITGTADIGGVVTFYLGRPPGINFAPIGIDNIEITSNKPILPKITSQKVLPVCVANPVILKPSAVYPAGTTYSWTSTALGTSSDRQFSVTPPDIQPYTVNLSVALPGCAPAAAEAFTLEVKACCTADNGVPMAETFVFYDDFGEFAGTSSYQYRAADGSLQPGSVDETERYYFNQNPPIATKPPGFTSAYTYWSDSPAQHERALIIPWLPYTSPLFYDNTTGDGTGGLLFFGLGSSGNMNKVLYEREICGLCANDKEIKFGASYSAANTKASGVFEVELRLMEGNETNLGAVLASSGTKVLTSPNWESFETTFKITDPSMTCVTLQVISKKDDYNGDNIGDLALDDIYASVCTPPDVDVSSSLTGPELLNLCSDKPLTIEAIISQSAKDYYGEDDIRYLFQYTFDNPSTTLNPVWKDLSEIQKDPKFTIEDPGNDDAFPDDKQMTYFRVVTGKEAQLKDPEQLAMDAQSPCRNVSISSVPVEATKNCATCTKPVSVKILADGVFKDTVGLCESETVTLEVDNLY
ncbi:MAG: hypothetical protein LBR52_02430, partial [Prevotellaceae bacterium]|nr:hypothetical protein [Prevotellaceae bacterium]